ncbi:MAG: D-alanyl-D-alanine carboxypeptidase/D-alanyl-D-alanine-endopeptidase [Acidobacteriia bacterium]|nr:D-alanyl-D-alanine carboxypeptidase/D-alanyl-D-alanine-endopeptidase [Terriglobia bacterium]
MGRFWAALLLASIPCAAADLPQAIDALMGASPVARASVGIQVVDLKTGNVLYTRNADRLFLPASNMKLFTAALALERLGPDYRLTTRLVRAPSGDLILVGGGDPSMSGRTYPYQKELPYQKDAPATNPLRAIEELADRAVAAGIVRVDGDIVGDDQLYPWAPYPPSWTVDDVTQEDGAPVSALTVNDNAITLAIHPAARAGELAAVSLEPAIEYFAVDNRVLTVAGEKEARIRVTRLQGSRQLLVWGSIPLAGATAREIVALDDPALFAACALYDALARRGVAIRGRPVARHRSASEDPWPVEGEVIATRTSPPMVEILQVIQKVSENLHAELMLREVARVTRGAGTRESGLQELGTWLTSIGIKTEEWRAEDGSGLSRNDEVSPRAVTSLLSHMAASKNGTAWLSLLPVGGEDGTLEHRLCCVSDASVARKVRAKTGSLTRAVALSGYADSRTRGRLAFSILVNNFSAPQAEVRAWVDRIALALVE